MKELRSQNLLDNISKGAKIKFNTMKYPVVIHKSKYGFDVYCPILPGCNSQGDTLEEALENIKDAITTYLDMVKKETAA